MLTDSAQEDKILYTKDEALIKMIALGETMKIEKGSQYYCYRDGIFYVSTTSDFKESSQCNINWCSAINNWIRIS